MTRNSRIYIIEIGSEMNAALHYIFCEHKVTTYTGILVFLKVTISCPVKKKFICIELLLRGHLSYKATFSSSQR